MPNFIQFKLWVQNFEPSIWSQRFFSQTTFFYIFISVTIYPLFHLYPSPHNNSIPNLESIAITQLLFTNLQTKFIALKDPSQYDEFPAIENPIQTKISSCKNFSPLFFSPIRDIEPVNGENENDKLM
jgi:hypothetical protein